MTQELGWLVRNKGGLTSSPKPGRYLFFSLSLMETAFIKWLISINFHEGLDDNVANTHLEH